MAIRAVFSEEWLDFFVKVGGTWIFRRNGRGAKGGDEEPSRAQKQADCVFCRSQKGLLKGPGHLIHPNTKQIGTQAVFE